MNIYKQPSVIIKPRLKLGESALRTCGGGDGGAMEVSETEGGAVEGLWLYRFCFGEKLN